MSVAINIVNLLTRKHAAFQSRRENVRIARKNLELLNDGDRKILHELLANHKSRFQIGSRGSRFSLLQKDILVEVKQLQGIVTCDLHPGILSIRKELQRELADMQKD